MLERLSWRARFVKFALRRTIKKIMSSDLPIEMVRDKLDSPSFFKKLLIKGDVCGITEVFNGVKVEWVGDMKSKKVLLYFHGGGYIFGLPKTYCDLASAIGTAFDACALIPYYRRAPENPFPAAVDDAFACYEGLLAKGIDAKNIIISGDSAGGGLSMALLLKLKDEKRALPCAAILLSPWLDLTCSGKSFVTEADNEDVLTNKLTKRATAYYHRDTPAEHPYVSPLFGDLKGLPPILVQVGTQEILYSDATRFVKKAQAAGVDAKLEAFYALPHVFHLFFGFVPESREAVRKIGQFIKAL